MSELPIENPSTAETVKTHAYRDVPGSGQHRAAQIESLDLARRDASLAPTFDKLVDATLALASSSQSLQAEVKNLVCVIYVLLGVFAAGEATALIYMLTRR